MVVAFGFDESTDDDNDDDDDVPPSNACLPLSSNAGIVSPTKQAVNASRFRQSQLDNKLVDIMMSF